MLCYRPALVAMALHRILFLFFFALGSHRAHAELSEAEVLAIVAGRIIGASQVCRVDRERLHVVTDQVHTVIEITARTRRDALSADRLIKPSLDLGRDEARRRRDSCRAVRNLLAKLERKVKVPGVSGIEL